MHQINSSTLESVIRSMKTERTLKAKVTKDGARRLIGLVDCWIDLLIVQLIDDCLDQLRDVWPWWIVVDGGCVSKRVMAVMFCFRLRGDLWTGVRVYVVVSGESGSQYRVLRMNVSWGDNIDPHAHLSRVFSLSLCPYFHLAELCLLSLCLEADTHLFVVLGKPAT